MNKKEFIALMIICISIGLAIPCIIAYSLKRNIKKEDPIEIIKKENEKLIIEVEHLDSLKDAEIIEVQSLDDDSTVKLFYKLIRE